MSTRTDRRSIKGDRIAAHGIRRTGKAALALMSVALSVPSLTPSAAAVTALSTRGADVSTAQRALDLGAKYHDANVQNAARQRLTPS
ncbi:hypothetical protein KIPE111705_03870 [Kibdelosporangium persicum]|uniref:hypothetical protein n=1 Tax=Kibdelosporangium persicum TaxID=2698649 RepID=UPI00156390B9|nr:hypothetical protein [Kibdelosporangium persicum]